MRENAAARTKAREKAAPPRSARRNRARQLGRLRALSSVDIGLIEELAAAEARESFWKFRLYMDPKLLRGWWQHYLCQELQRFYEDLIAGKRPTLFIGAPPQHGKSRLVADFIAWCCGRHPEWNVMFSSYADDLCTRQNRYLQSLFMSDRFQRVFPLLKVARSLEGTKIALKSDMKPQQNTDIIEFAKYDARINKGAIKEVGGGSFRNPTVNGQTTGFGLDLGVVDDPIKGRAEASSKTIREKVWNWFLDDFLSRFSDRAGFLMIMTRWHVDDPAGRFFEHFPSTRKIAFPAIAKKSEVIKLDGKMATVRKEGQALFPQHKSLAFLLLRKKAYSQASWESLYQQSPIVVGGGIFPIEKFSIDEWPPPDKQIRKAVRYWDKAGTEDGGAATAGVLMYELHSGEFVIADVRHGHWGALKRETIIEQTAKADGRHVYVYVEQEPGSGGKESAENTVRRLKGFKAFADKVTGNKELRAEPYSAQVQGANVRLVSPRNAKDEEARALTWITPFLDQHEVFPNGPLKDIVDAAAGAFNMLVGKRTYDTTNRWVE